jgi:hypothetical protein
MSSPEPPPEGLAEHFMPRGPELEYSKEPLIIGENCFGDAVELPPELRDRGIADFCAPDDDMVTQTEPLLCGGTMDAGSIVYNPNEQRWLESIERLEKVYTEAEIKDIMSKAAAELEKKFLPLLDEMVVPYMPYPSWEDALREHGLDPDKYVATGSEWRDGVLHVSLAEKQPLQYIEIHLSKIGDEDAGQDETDGEAGREVQG